MKTLHKYLTMDLVKTTAMSTAAFTLMMTVVGILEPLRKEGLAAKEVVSVLGLTFLLMLSLALPIATLFAATIVYGRFSQDNELTACRASGVSTMGVLKPVLWTGAVVTLLSLLLSNIVVPHMAKRAGIAMYSNMKGMFFNVLSQRGTFDDFKDVIIRAEEADLSNSVLLGPVVIRKRTDAPLERDRDGKPIPEAIPFMVAAEAHVLGFKQTPGGDTYVRIWLVDPRGELRERLGILESGVVEWGPLPNPMKKSSSMWSDWPTLWASLKDATRYREIGESLREHRRDIGNMIFAREVRDTINDGDPYLALGDKSARYEISASRAEREGASAVALESGIGADGEPVWVEVREIGAGGRTVVRRAGHGEIETDWSAFRNVSTVTIHLSEPVYVTDGSGAAIEERRKGPWKRGGELSLPEHISRKLEDDISLGDLLADPAKVIDDLTELDPAANSPASIEEQKIIDHIAFLRDVRAPKLNNDVVALMHFRVSYGASCFLMVAMGAALGLMFRGGQVLVAFAIALIPVAIVGFMGVMGYGMVRNPDVPTVVGLMCIWGGIAIILLTNVAVYWHLSRK